MKRISVGIIGGGIGGVTAAVALRHFGIDATVYEKAGKLREMGAGMVLWANATRVLSELGLLGKVLAASGATENFLVRKHSGEVLMEIATGNFEVPSVCIPRADLLSILVSALPAENIKLDHEFKSLVQTGDKVRVSFAEREAEHDVLIGADGLRSRVRSEIFGAREPLYHGYMIWRGIGYGISDAIAPNTSSETWGKGKRFGILNTGRDKFTWYATANLSFPHQDSEKGRRAELLEMFSDWHAPIADLIASTPENLILKHGAHDHDSMRNWVRQHVALLGDAAHACTPNLGQGGGMAIEDALVLAKSLHTEKSIENALTLYEKRRRVRTGQIRRKSLLMGKIGQMENALLVAGRELLTNILPAKIFEFNLRRACSYKT